MRIIIYLERTIQLGKLYINTAWKIVKLCSGDDIQEIFWIVGVMKFMKRIGIIDPLSTRVGCQIENSLKTYIVEHFGHATVTKEILVTHINCLLRSNFHLHG